VPRALRRLHPGEAAALASVPVWLFPSGPSEARLSRKTPPTDVGVTRSRRRSEPATTRVFAGKLDGKAWLRSGAEDREVRRRLSRLLWLGRLDLLILVAVVWLMVFKPGGPSD